jgi:acetyl esterase/lipase
MEGHNVARWLAGRGVVGFVLKHRLAREEGSTYTIEGESLDDAQRAIRLIRSQASKWAVDPERIGIIGFSAGGEIAALAATNHDSGQVGATDPIERESSRPAFEALIYPAIPKDMMLSSDMPPSFLACGEDDR